MKPSRPLTHDLFKSFVESFHVEIREVLIYNLVEGVFYAKIVCEKDGDVVEIDARTSDAIAVGIRAGCPVYTFEHILSSAGIQLEDEIEAEGPAQEEKVEEAKETNELKAASPKELEAMLQDAIDREDYERASEIRDELNKRN